MRNNLIEIHFPRKNSETCLWFLLLSEKFSLCFSAPVAASFNGKLSCSCNRFSIFSCDSLTSEIMGKTYLPSSGLESMIDGNLKTGVTGLSSGFDCKWLLSLHQVKCNRIKKEIYCDKKRVSSRNVTLGFFKKLQIRSQTRGPHRLHFSSHKPKSVNDYEKQEKQRLTLFV